MTQFRNKYVQAMLNLSTDFKKCWELEKTQLPYFALKISFFSPELLFFYVYAEQLKKKSDFCIGEIALITWKMLLDFDRDCFPLQVKLWVCVSGMSSVW